jgi:hypothetical protein
VLSLRGSAAIAAGPEAVRALGSGLATLTRSYAAVRVASVFALSECTPIGITRTGPPAYKNRMAFVPRNLV